MNTNYQNLNHFEISTVILIFLGVGLAGTIFFSALNFQQQKNIASAVNMFDLHEQAISQLDSMEFVFSTTDAYYQQFYNAFAELAVLPEEDISYWETFGQQTRITLDNFLNYSDQIALNYNQLNQTVKPNFAGSVAGASIVNHDPVYQPPNLNLYQRLTRFTEYIHSP